MIERVYMLDTSQAEQLQQRIKNKYPNVNIKFRVTNGSLTIKIYTTDTLELMGIGEIIGRFIAEQSFTL